MTTRFPTPSARLRSRVAFALAAAALALLPTAAAGVLVDVVTNGDFEAGTTGWTNGSTGFGTPPTLVPSCAPGGGTMALFENLPSGHLSWQAISTPLALKYQLQFDAQATNVANAGGSVVDLASHWDGGAGYADRFLEVGFRAGTVYLVFSVSGTHAVTPVTTPAPTDGLCHHYEVFVYWDTDPALRFASLRIDGAAAVGMGGTDNVIPPDVLFLGDVAGCDCGRPAPDVAFDNVKFGPLF
ncbi:MAG: hypothetical protein QOE90_3284 [Thermoplasmata archaeon]|jgi:hypothetical protein|nr:hypothetical protein [Thermoplasmata archaeon]